MYLYVYYTILQYEIPYMCGIGHVDAGKSTLMGHLLFLLGNISDRAMHK